MPLETSTTQLVRSPRSLYFLATLASTFMSHRRIDRIARLVRVARIVRIDCTIASFAPTPVRLNRLPCSQRTQHRVARVDRMGCRSPLSSPL